MSNIGYDYAMGGLRTMDQMANLESARRMAQWQQDQASQEAESQAIGTLVGGVAGGVKGYYDRKLEGHNAEQAKKRRDQETKYGQKWMEAVRNKEAPPAREEFQPETFDFVQAVKRDLGELKWL